MLYRTRDDEIPIPIERDTGWVHMAVTGDIGHGIGSASVVKAPKLDGAPEVTAGRGTNERRRPDGRTA